MTKPKKSVTAYKSWDTVLKCDIFGYPFPVITWTRSLKQLPFNRHVIDGNKLTIKNTTEDDDGAYVCQGANELGSVMAVTWIFVKDEGKLIIWKVPKTIYNKSAIFYRYVYFFLEVNPYIVSSPPSEIQVSNVGDSVKLNCSARGSPLPKVKWFKNGRRVISSVAMHDGKDLITSELVIQHFKPRDAGKFTCLFYNDKNRTVDVNTSLSK